MSSETGTPHGAHAASTVLWPTIAGYELVGEIAAGGMATVYLGRPTTDEGNRALVAIKHCHPHLRHDPAFVAMFLDEARLASLIRHPNVVHTLDVGNADSLYFVMQYVDGVSLAEWLAHLGTVGSRIEVPLLLRVMVDALAGLEAAHALTDDTGKLLRLVHRDVSPQNILVGLDGVAKISDFGIAKAESRATRTRTGQVKGKTGYMSPEQILLEPLDLRSDLYAVGVVMWEALTGNRLFDGDSDAATINLVLSGKIPAPSTVAGTDVRLDPLVLKALAFEPDQRFTTACAMAEAIVATGIEIAPSSAVGECISTLFAARLQERRRALAAYTSPSAPKPTQRHWLRLGLLAAMLCLVIGLIAHFWGSVSPRDNPASASTTQAPAYATVPLAPTEVPRNDGAPSATEYAPSTPLSTALAPPPTTRQWKAPAKASSATASTGARPSPTAPPASASSVAAPRNKARPSEYRPNDL